MIIDFIISQVGVDGLTPFLAWLEDSAVNDWVLGSAWIWPAMETIHFLGLSLLIGALIFVDMRVLGFAGKAPLNAMHGFVPIAVTGFVLNLITGILFFVGDPFRYAPNIAFQAKMFVILLAGLNLLYFELKVHPKIKAGGDDVVLGFDAKIAAGLSLAFWLFVVVAGRMIPYFEYY